MAVTDSKTHSTNTKVPPPMEVLSVKCASCGFTEECTPAYILRVRDRYQGRWICGLCVEAVKEEVIRSERFISTEEALNRHINFCKNFRSSRSVEEAEHPISAIGRLLRRSLDCPRPLRSSSSNDIHVVQRVPSSSNDIHVVQRVPSSVLIRSDSCVPSLSR